MRRTLSEPGRRRAAPRRGTLFLSLVAVSALAAVLSGPARGQSPAPSTDRPAPASDPIFARVDGQPVRRSELETRRDRSKAAYVRETGREVPPAFETFFLRTALEEAVRERLLAKEGRAGGIRISDAAAESVLKRDAAFHKGGRYDPSLFAAYKQANPKSFAQVREEARDYVTFQRRARALEEELEPDAATLDGLVAARTEKVDVRWLLVSESHFDGRTDPSDDEIRAAYARDREAFAPPGRVSFSRLTFSGLEDGRMSMPGLLRARRNAEALLAELQGGLPFDSAATRPGVLPAIGTWGEGQAEGVFASAPAWAESAYASPPGRILPRIIETLEGMSIIRVDRPTPRVTPPLAEVAADVRARVRAEQAATRRTAEARRLYDAERDSFRVETWLVRHARIDVSRVPVKAPKEAQLRDWFDRHPGEFARLDPSGGGLRTLAFEEARDEAEKLYLAEQRVIEARLLADRVAGDWARGKSGPKSGPALEVGDPVALIAGGPIPAELRADLADSARAWRTGPRVLVANDPRGFAVVGLVRRSEGERLPFEVVEPHVREVLARRELDAERRAAQAWFETHRERYETGPGYAVTFALGGMPTRNIVDVPGPAIERYYRENPGAFMPPEEVHVRHILFRTQSRSLAEARTLAREARGKIARGELFASLARAISEDPGTREQGGDLGWISRGGTVPEFERAAFALTAAQPNSQPIETEFGVHLLHLVEKRGGTLEPFEAVRSRITQLLVEQYADTLARRKCDQLKSEVRTRDHMVRRAAELGMPAAAIRWHEGFPFSGPAILDQFRADAVRTQPGELLPGVYRYLDQGYVIGAVDSVLASRRLEFDEVADRVLQDFRQETGRAAALARVEQVERELAAGRTWEEATETLGGSPVAHRIGHGDPLPGFGGWSAIDSTLFGPGAPRAGELRRLESPRGLLLLQVAARVPAEVDVLRREREKVRRIVLNRRVYDHVETLREKAKIETLRPELAERLPAPPRL